MNAALVYQSQSCVINAFYAMNFLYVAPGVCSQPFQLLSLGEANIIKQYSFWIREPSAKSTINIHRKKYHKIHSNTKQR